MKKTTLFLSLIATMTLCSCDNDVKGTWKSIVATSDNIITTNNTTVPPFNTAMNIMYFLHDKNEEGNEQILKDVTNLYVNEIARLHKQFDRHYYYYESDVNSNIVTNIKTINDSYGTNTPVKCSDELYELLKISVNGYEITNGYFNIFTGSLTDYWNQIFNSLYSYETTIEQIDPYFNETKKEELELIVSSIPNTIEEVKQQLTFDDENKTVTFNKIDKNVIRPYISVGGVAKGLATDIVKNKMIEKNLKDGYLVSGGSSISTISKPIYTSKQKGQNLKIINPATSNIVEKNVAFSMKFTEEFNFSTSGNYTTGKSYSFIDNSGNIIYRHHIINPFSGYPESYYRSISISTHTLSNAMVDILSTALMNISVEDGKKLRNQIKQYYPESDLEVFYLMQKGSDEEAKMSVYATSNMNNTLTAEEGVTITYEK